MHDSILRRLLMLLCVTLLAGACANPSTPLAPATGAQIVSHQQGIVVLSMAHTTNSPGHFEFRYRSVGAKGTQSVMWIPTNIFRGDRIDYNDSGSRGAVFIQAVEPGDYEWVNFNAGLQGATNFSAKNAPRVPFRVAAGQVTYLGEVLFDAWRRPNLWGQMIYGGYYVVVRDRAARDLETARQKQPQLRTLPVSAQVPNAVALKHPLYRSRLMSSEELKVLENAKTQ